MQQAFSFMESLQDQVSADIKDWSQVGGEPYDKLGFEGSSRELLVRESRKAMYRVAHARGIIRTLVKFIIGAGIVVDFNEKDENKSERIARWFKKVRKKIKWYSFLEELVMRAFRDGEVFIQKIKPSSRYPYPTFSFIEPEYVSDPIHKDGIETEDGNVLRVLKYHIQYPGSVPIALDASEVIHAKIEVTANTRRGRPILEPCFPYLTKYGKWLDARMVLNVIRTSVALVREVQGSATDLSRLRNAQQAQKQRGSETDKAKMLRPGTILSASPGSKWSMLSPNLDARDAAEDGRTILLAIAAAIGFPDVFVTADYANSNFACHSDDTEALTYRGWIFFEDLTKEDYIATQHPISGNLEFQKPSEIHSYLYNGNLQVYDGKRVNFAITPNHSLIAVDYKSNKKNFAKTATFPISDYRKIEVRDLEQSKFYLLPTKVIWEGEKQDSFLLPSGQNVNMDNWLEFLGYVITDGCVTDSKYCIEIGQESGWKAEKIERCVRNLNLSFRKSIRPKRGEWAELTIFHIGDNKLREFVSGLIGTKNGVKSWQKHLPNFIWNLASCHLHCLLDALIFGDGGEYKRHPGSTQRVFNTTSQQLGDEVQRLAFMLGFASKLSISEPLPHYDDGYERHKMYRVHLGDGHPQLLKTPLLRSESYDGKVWCATVPNGSLVTRRNGRILISGNSTVVAQNPAIREFETRQNWFTEVFEDAIDFIVECGIENGAIVVNKIIDDVTGEEEYDLDYDIKFPPLLKRDLAQDTTAYKTMHDSGVISVRTWGLNFGFDPDMEQRQREQEKDLLPQPAPKGTSTEPVVDPSINHRKAIAPKDASMRTPRQRTSA